MRSYERPTEVLPSELVSIRSLPRRIRKKKPKNKNYVVVRINSALKKKQDNQNVTKNISSPKRQPYFGPELQIDKDLNVADIYDCEYIYMCIYEWCN